MGQNLCPPTLQLGTIHCHPVATQGETRYRQESTGNMNQLKTGKQQSSVTSGRRRLPSVSAGLRIIATDMGMNL